jgi:hypothetical protein
MSAGACLARERGPKLDKIVRLPIEPTEPKEPRRGEKAPTKLWAGFVLSGLGK